MAPRLHAAIKRALGILVLALLLGSAFLWGAEKERPRGDRHGDSLPPGAIARLVNKDKSSVLGIAFSPDGRLLASSSPDDGEHDIHLWNVETAKEMRTHSKPDSLRIWGPAFAPDGKCLATSSRGDLLLWNVVSGRPLRWKGERYRATSSFSTDVTFSPDGKTMVWSAGSFVNLYSDRTTTVHLCETLTGEERVGTAPAYREKFTTSFAFSPRGRLLAIGTYEGAIHLWNLAEERMVRTLTFDGAVNKVAFSPNGGQLFAIGYVDRDKYGQLGKSLRSWDVASGKPMLRLTGEDPNKQCLAISPNGRLVAIAIGNRASLRDSTTGEERAAFTSRARLGINALAFSPDGSLLATADKEILLWDLSSIPQAKRTDRTEKPITTRSLADFDAEEWPRKELERCWADLGGGDAVAAYRAIGSLARHPQQS